MQIIKQLIDGLFFYTFIYPVFMSFVWIIGALIFQFKFNRKIKYKKEVGTFDEEFFTVVIPVFNEEANLLNSLQETLLVDYNNFEVLIIDDHSTDNSAQVIRDFCAIHDKFNCILLDENIGKAQVLNLVLDQLKGDYFLCLDSDASLAPDALTEFNKEIKTAKVDYAAITGSPKLYNPELNTTRRIQQLEYRSIIGMIKRAQSVFFGNIMTVSGVCTLYRIKDIKEVNGFDPKVAAEDIDISWRLTTLGKKLEYLPTATVFMHSPTTINSLLLQRKRWALGGLQTVSRNMGSIFSLSCWGLKMMFLEVVASSIWVLSYMVSTLYLVSKILFHFPSAQIPTFYILPTLVLFITSICLLSIAYAIDYGVKEPVKLFFKNFWVYAILYWLIMPLSYILAFGTFLFKRKEDGKWRLKSAPKIKMRTMASYLFDFILIFILTYFSQDILVTIYNNLNENSIQQVYFFLAYFIIYLTLLYYYFFYNHGKTLGLVVFGLEIRNKNIIRTTFFNPILIIIFGYFLAIFFNVLFLLAIGITQDIYKNLYDNIIIYNMICTTLLIILMIDEYTLRIVPRLRGTVITKENDN